MSSRNNLSEPASVDVENDPSFSKLPLDPAVQTPDAKSLDSPKKALPKTASWTTIGLLMIAEVVGSGVLALPFVFSQLGWFLGVSTLVLAIIASGYLCLKMFEARLLWEGSNSLRAITAYAFGTSYGNAAGMLVYVLLFVILGGYLFVVGQSLSYMFYSFKYCNFLWTTFALLAALPLTRIRLLGATHYLMILNLLTIVLVVGLTLGSIGMYTTEQRNELTNGEPIKTELFASTLTVWVYFASLAKIAFSVMGAFICLEFIAEMYRPTDFYYSVIYIFIPVQIIIYLTTASVGYGLLGHRCPPLFLDGLKPGPVKAAAGTFLFIHILVSYTVNSTVFCRALHEKIFPKTAFDYKSTKATLRYMSISIVNLVLVYFVAVLIPFYDSLVSIAGVLFPPFVSFGIPIALIYRARRVQNKKITNWEYVLWSVLMLSQILLFFLGGVGTIMELIQNWKTLKSPFDGC